MILLSKCKYHMTTSEHISVTLEFLSQYQCYYYLPNQDFSAHRLKSANVS